MVEEVGGEHVTRHTKGGHSSGKISSFVHAYGFCWKTVGVGVGGASELGGMFWYRCCLLDRQTYSKALPIWEWKRSLKWWACAYLMKGSTITAACNFRRQTFACRCPVWAWNNFYALDSHFGIRHHHFTFTCVCLFSRHFLCICASPEVAFARSRMVSYRMEGSAG